MDRRRILILTSSLLTDRMLLYSSFFETLLPHAEVEVWAASMATNSHVWSQVKEQIDVRTLPARIPRRMFPWTYLSRACEHAFDLRSPSPSRQSFTRYLRRTRRVKLMNIAFRVAGRAMWWLRIDRKLRNILISRSIAYPFSPEAGKRLDGRPCDLAFIMNPFLSHETPFLGEFVKRGIPTLALIPSWDNISTKPEMGFRFGAYAVWSHDQKQQLIARYKVPADCVHTIGAPQFDVFFSSRFKESREDFFFRHGLDFNRSLVVYALGSPHFLREAPGVSMLTELLNDQDRSRIQILVRPHPIHNNLDLRSLFSKMAGQVNVQQIGMEESDRHFRTQGEQDILDWVSTFRFADVVINTASSVALDAAFFDCPVVNLLYDPCPDQRDANLIREINNTWTHYAPVTSSGGIWNARDPSEAVRGIRACLTDRTLMQEGRRRMLEMVVTYSDGQSGQRLAKLLLELVAK